MSENSPSKVVIRYPNQSGAIVEVAEFIGVLPGVDAPLTCYSARCPACLDDHAPHSVLSAPRKWARIHSEICRALPQPEPADRPQAEQ